MVIKSDCVFDSYAFVTNRRSYRVGQPVTRLLGGQVVMYLTVTHVYPSYILCGLGNSDAGIYKFDIATGAEIDDELQWGPAYGASGSFIS